MALALLAACHGGESAEGLIKSFSHDADDLRVASKLDTFGQWDNKLGSASKGASGADATKLNQAMQANSAIIETLSDSNGHVAVDGIGRNGEGSAERGRDGRGASTVRGGEHRVVQGLRVQPRLEGFDARRADRGSTENRRRHRPLNTVDVVVEASNDSVRTAAVRLLAGTLSGGFLRAANWGIYANEMRSKVEDTVGVQEDGTSQTLSVKIAGPVTTHTRAFYEYARVCLTPPQVTRPI
jgi:hypothetical protein